MKTKTPLIADPKCPTCGNQFSGEEIPPNTANDMTVVLCRVCGELLYPDKGVIRIMTAKEFCGIPAEIAFRLQNLVVTFGCCKPKETEEHTEVE